MQKLRGKYSFQPDTTAVLFPVQQSNIFPVAAAKKLWYTSSAACFAKQHAGMMELADMRDLGRVTSV